MYGEPVDVRTPEEKLVDAQCDKSYQQGYAQGIKDGAQLVFDNMNGRKKDENRY